VKPRKSGQPISKLAVCLTAVEKGASEVSKASEIWLERRRLGGDGDWMRRGRGDSGVRIDWNKKVCTQDQERDKRR
jgi:hypothetical protein